MSEHSINPNAADGQCDAIKYIGDAGYFRLECDLASDHQELHWDSEREIAWSHWSALEEETRNKHARIG